MGTTLTGATVASTYDSIIKVGNNGPIDANVRTLSDGLGNDLPMAVSDTVVDFTSATAISGSTFSGSFVGDGSGLTGVGGGSPGGSNTHIQYNDAGAFGGSANFTFNDTTNIVTLNGTLAVLGATLQTGDYTNSTGNATLTNGDLTLSAGDITMNNGDIDINGNITLTTAGNQIILPTAGSVTKADGIVYPTVDSWGEGLDTYATGESIALGSTISTTEGRIYCWRAGGGWVAADANSQANSAGLLGVSTNGGTVNRFFIRGLISTISTNITGTPAIGSVLYLSETTAGTFDTAAPTGTGDVVRKVGQILDSYTSGRSTYYKIWFDPDWYYTTV